MRAEVVAVGTELLLGQIDNGNARWISERLAAIGVDVRHHQVVGDNLERIVDALRLALDRAEAVVVTGGLGPTQDDLTRDAIAALLGRGLARDEAIVRTLEERFRGASDAPMPASVLRQADVPVGARAIAPTIGTAPGLVAELDGRTLYALPGVPAEMREMVERVVLPELARRSGAGAIVSRVVRCTGIGESRVAELLDDLYRGSTNPTVAFLASTGEVRVRVTAKAGDPSVAEALAEPMVAEIAKRLGDVVFSVEDEPLEQVVLRLLRVRGWTIACAESLTGGRVTARLTAPPGASATVLGAAVAYTAEAKRRLLRVSEAVLAAGVVSEACARAMAAGARRVFGADVALALTGAAGPEPHDGAPPGTVWLAVETPELAHARLLRVGGERDRVVRWAGQAGLDLVRRALEGRPLPSSEHPI
ncbi:MAG: CinA-like protein [Actinomycetota bacterium]|nr:MAG: CinA-like protein [Actinomycetota bacterium]